MTTVIADTSPVNYLVLIGEIDVLHGLFGEVLMPPAVYEELRQEGAPPEVRTWAGSLPSWAKIVPARLIDKSIELGKGETEAISLAREINADVLLIDEKLGRVEAKLRGVHTVGTVLLLAIAHEKGLLNFDIAIAKLKETTFRVSTSVIAAVRAQIRGLHNFSEG